MDRRRFLHGAAAAGALGAAWPLAGRLAPGQALAQAALIGVRFDPAPFTLGVASGDPTADRVVLWTRLAPEPLTDGADPRASGLPATVEVDWVVAEDPRLRRVVARGAVAALPEQAYTVHADVGGLVPGRTYWYRFAALGRVSRIGRTRTLPAGPTGRFRLGWVSCANLPAGSFVAYERMAAEDLDLVACLGDYLYEGGGTGAGRDHTGGEIVSVADYRNRHALYKGDPALRAAHAAFPWIFTWDDHEVDNNYAGGVPENANAAEGNDTPERFLARRAASYQAYYEHLPLRPTAAGPPAGPDYRIYKSVEVGDLLEIDVLDTRQYRDDQPCGDFDAAFRVICTEVDDPARTMLGAPQKAWLTDRLTASSAAWKVLLSSVMVAPWQVRQGLPDDVDAATLAGLGFVPIDDRQSVNADQWDGYTAERDELLRFVADEGVEDVVVLVGDLHSTWVTDLRLDFDDPTAPTVATEFVGTAITSAFPIASNEAFGILTLATNPHVRYFDGERRGYGVVELGPDALDVAFRTVGTAADPRAPVTTTATWRVQRGTAGARRTDGGGPLPS